MIYLQKNVERFASSRRVYSLSIDARDHVSADGGHNLVLAFLDCQLMFYEYSCNGKE